MHNLVIAYSHCTCAQLRETVYEFMSICMYVYGWNVWIDVGALTVCLSASLSVCLCSLILSYIYSWVTYVEYFPLDVAYTHRWQSFHFAGIADDGIEARVQHNLGKVCKGNYT